MWSASSSSGRATGTTLSGTTSCALIAGAGILEFKTNLLMIVFELACLNMGNARHFENTELVPANKRRRWSLLVDESLTQLC